MGGLLAASGWNSRLCSGLRMDQAASGRCAGTRTEVREAAPPSFYSLPPGTSRFLHPRGPRGSPRSCPEVLHTVYGPVAGAWLGRGAGPASPGFRLPALHAPGPGWTVVVCQVRIRHVCTAGRTLGSPDSFSLSWVSREIPAGTTRRGGGHRVFMAQPWGSPKAFALVLTAGCLCVPKSSCSRATLPPLTRSVLMYAPCPPLGTRVPFPVPSVVFTRGPRGVLTPVSMRVHAQ